MRGLWWERERQTGPQRSLQLSAVPETILVKSIVQRQVVLISTSKSLSLFLQSLGGDVAKTSWLWEWPSGSMSSKNIKGSRERLIFSRFSNMPSTSVQEHYTMMRSENTYLITHKSTISPTPTQHLQRKDSSGVLQNYILTFLSKSFHSWLPNLPQKIFPEVPLGHIKFHFPLSYPWHDKTS